jgi:eukaryotic-like serine/threonine-protein kinase
MMRIQLKQAWELGGQIGDESGFGQVYEATSANGATAALKLIPKKPGAQRELLFIDQPGVRNVIPVIDDGETDDHWVLVMPKAEMSLRKYLNANPGPLPVADAVAILSDIVTCLVDLNGRVVHRDLKPENILLHNCHWCLADFGISRYAEASTAADTRRFILTPRYAAPEAWKFDRPTAETDVYSLGVIAYELLSGSRPFTDGDGLRKQHLEDRPPELVSASLGLRALVDECLYKAPETGPTPNNLLARLQRAVEAPPSAGLARLQQANHANVMRFGEMSRQESVRQSVTERRKAMADAANQGLSRIGDLLRDMILTYAPSASGSVGLPIGWTILLDKAELHLDPPKAAPANPWGEQPLAIEVIAFSTLSLKIPAAGRDDYQGRSHSLWYCDAQQAGEFHWYETAFMPHPMKQFVAYQEPFALNPNSDSGAALRAGASFNAQVAWPFTLLDVGDPDEFIGRWAGWLAEASQGQLRRPPIMPERDVQGSWRVA